MAGQEPSAEKTRRPSPLQRRALIVLAALDEKRPGPVATRDIERVLEKGGEAPVYGPNLRGSCRRMEAAGWLRTLRAPNLQLAVELTDIGRAFAVPLTGQTSPAPQSDAPVDRLVLLDDVWHLACRADYVICLDGTTGLQLWNATGQRTGLKGDAVQVAAWLQACHGAGIALRVQVNESHTPEDGEVAVPAPADQTDAWFRQLDVALQDLEITGLTEEIRQGVVTPGEAFRPLLATVRLLQILSESEEAFPLTSSRYEEEAGEALDNVLTRTGLTPDQAQELRRHRIRWARMSEDEFARRELNGVLDERAMRRLFCDREKLTDIIFSPARPPGEPWTARLQWLLSGGLAGGFHFRSTASRETDRAMVWLAGYIGEDAAMQLAAVMAWEGDTPTEKP
ncbi:hypothetical protein D6445_11845 [Salmonella enterica subsp. enterica serovar Infantis]|nr:hypothetical protein [Salmonella enterica subsp. enterica serovar Infantis]EGI5923281.1 hypothetical protein [Salmonella enterica subsp. enterica serovar Colindale]